MEFKGQEKSCQVSFLDGLPVTYGGTSLSDFCRMDTFPWALLAVKEPGKCCPLPQNWGSISQEGVN